MSAQAADRVPTAAIAGAGGMIALTLVLVAFVRLSGLDIREPPPQRTVAERTLHFDDRADGAVVVTDAATGAEVAVLAPGTNNFLRATMRNLAHERRAHGIGAEPPFRLIAGADGRLLLEDPSIGRRIELEAFGPTNAGAFAALLGVRP